MSDPKRWKETEGQETQALVLALSSLEPSSAIRESVWQKLAVTLPPEPGSGSPDGGAQGGSQGSTQSSQGQAATQTVASASGVGKAMGAAIAILGVGAAVFFALSPSEPAVSGDPSRGTAPPLASNTISLTPAATPSVVASTVVAPTVVTPEVKEPTPRPARVSSSVVTTRAPAFAAPDAGEIATTFAEPEPAAAVSKIDRLREEAEGVRNAQRLLREKQAPAALAELVRLERRFPAGGLAEEREVLTIEALFASRNEDAGSKRAERYLFEHPRSMHAPRVRSLLAR